MPKLGYYERGTWNAQCDECGFGYKANVLKIRWDNARVCPSCWEPRQPQDFARAVKDDPSVPFARPRIGGSGGITTTTSSMSPSSTFVNIADSSAIPGNATLRVICVIFDPANLDIVEKVSALYASGFTLSSLHRGVLGTSAHAWSSGVTVQYLGTSVSSSTP